MTSLKVSRFTNNDGNSTFLYPPAQSNEQIQAETVVDSQQLRKSVSEELNTFFEGKISVARSSLLSTPLNDWC
jgi:N-acetylmuramoyl-L-alanine amidase